MHVFQQVLQLKFVVYLKINTGEGHLEFPNHDLVRKLQLEYGKLVGKKL